MRRFRYSSWKFMLVMFVLITIFFYDLGYTEAEKRKTPLKEIKNTSDNSSEDQFDAMEAR
jgi:hypothetical protein